MQAMIFAAGLGTRLRPLTDNRPKALVELAGKALLQHAIEKLKEAGISHIVINIHHFGEQIVDFLERNNNFGLDISISDERDQLLDTGGGLLKASSLFKPQEPVLVYNVDILCSMDLKAFMDYHIQKKGLVTMAVRDRKTARYLLFDKNMQLSGWTNISTGERIVAREDIELSPFAFSGIQIVDPKLFDLIEEQGKFSVIPLYLRLAQSQQIFGFEDQSEFWMDLGKLEQLEEAERLFR